MIDDAGEKVEHFNEKFLEVLERHAPVRKRKVRNRQCPFLDQEIKELMDERDQAHRVARESGAVTDWEHYRWCRNEVKRRLCDAERIHVQKEMNGNQSSSAMWSDTELYPVKREIETGVLKGYDGTGERVQ